MNSDKTSNTQDKGSSSSLKVSAEKMQAMSKQATDFLIHHYSNLSNEREWDGEFKENLNRIFTGTPPENGRQFDDVLTESSKMFSLIHSRIIIQKVSVLFQPHPPGQASSPIS